MKTRSKHATDKAVAIKPVLVPATEWDAAWQLPILTQRTHSAWIAHRRLNKKEGLPLPKSSVKTGFAALDDQIKDLRGGDLMVLAGRPSMGKSALALSMVRNVLTQRTPSTVLLFSLEIPRHAILRRLLASDAEVDLQFLHVGMLPRRCNSHLKDAATRLSATPLHINDTVGLTTAQVVTHAKRLAEDLEYRRFLLGKSRCWHALRLGLIVIDCIELLHETPAKGRRKTWVGVRTLRRLKRLAAALNVPIVATCQLSARIGSKKQFWHKPTMKDFKDPAIPRMADIVAFIKREGYYQRDNPKLQRGATLIVAKNPRGPKGPIKMRYVGEYTKFFNAN